MILSSEKFEAFFFVARTKNFSHAAKELHITQSALSQRIAKLEDDLQTTLFTRDTRHIALTGAGEILLRYYMQKSSLESECLGQLGLLRGENREFLGTLRIGGFSSVVKSLVLPALSPLFKDSSKMNLEIVTAQIRDVSSLLRSAKVDLILSYDTMPETQFENHFLGYEENVLIDSNKTKQNNVYIDQDYYDQTTFEFLALQNKKFPTIERIFVGDTYNILEGVRLGWGRAVMPKHLLHDQPHLKVVVGQKSLKYKVYLSYFKQPYYPKILTQAVSQIIFTAKEIF